MIGDPTLCSHLDIAYLKSHFINLKFMHKTHFQMLKIVANMLEICNASINFYMYCMCNKEIRLHFWDLISLEYFKRKRNMKGRERQISLSTETSLHSNQQPRRLERNTSDYFPEIFNKDKRILIQLQSLFPRR